MSSRLRALSATALVVLLAAGCSSPTTNGSSQGQAGPALSSGSATARASASDITAPTAPPFTDHPSSYPLFDDALTDPRVGWYVGRFGHGSVVQLHGRLRITVRDKGFDWVAEPSSFPAQQQLGFAADFSLPAANPNDLGAGLVCRGGSSATERNIYFTYQPVGYWLVVEVDGQGTTAEKAHQLGTGATYPRFKGDGFRVAAGCQRLPGGSTRLTMLLDGKQVWTDVANVPGVYPDGWERGVAVVSATGRTAVVDLTHYTRYNVPQS